MHDLFDILGLPVNAPASEVRRVCARRPRRAHPDFDPDPVTFPGAIVAGASAVPPRADVAIDFVDIAGLLDRIQASFFGNAH